MIAAVLTTSTVISATAADLGPQPHTKAPPAFGAIYNWSGFYVGASAGYGWARDVHQDETPTGIFWTNGPAGPLPGRQTINPDGAVYGG